MYKAKENIGDFKKGDIVPDEQAIVWSKMYKQSPVELINEKPKVNKKIEIKKEKPKEAKSSKGSHNPMLDDYLARNENVVKKNLMNDNIPKDTLEKLLKIEQSDKKRKKVINIIKHNLEVL